MFDIFLRAVFSVQRSGNKVRIRAQLIDGKTDHHLWSESYDGVMDDIFDLQDKITERLKEIPNIHFIQKQWGHRHQAAGQLCQ